jgi:Ca2+-binding EF-hand superfamily protein
MMPMGVSPQVAAKMMQASQVFRMFDRDHNGFLDKEEWKRAMYQLGYSTNKVDAKRLFYMADQDLSNRISERGTFLIRLSFF